MKLLQGDCLEKLKELEDNSVDSIVTDPPAGIAFMGKGWDSDKGGRDSWIAWMCEVATECLRVIKPGGHAFVWAIPRTSHWTATAWENAGFEKRDAIANFTSKSDKFSDFYKSLSIEQKKLLEIIMDESQVAHVFGSGFPKSHNIEKAIRKIDEEKVTQFIGFGTALKPAREEWILMRKPIEKGLSIAENCLKWGTGGINIDISRIGTGTGEMKEYIPNDKNNVYGKNMGGGEWDNSKGRFPANIILGADENGVHEEVRECFPETKSVVRISEDKDEQQNTWSLGRTGTTPRGHNDSGNASRYFKSIPQGRFPANLIHDNSEEVRACFPDTHGAGNKKDMIKNHNYQASSYKISSSKNPNYHQNNGGNASRFFKSIIYQAKPSKAERNRGCEGLETKTAMELTGRKEGSKGLSGSEEHGNSTNPYANGGSVLPRANFHPTVKPIKLLEYLIKMITPAGGTVLDPFAGSGTTGVACEQNGFESILIEMTDEYIPIIKSRVGAVKKPSQELLEI